MNIIYIAHPISGDIENNLKDLYRILRQINLNYANIVPIAPYIADVMSLKDTIQSERRKGINNSMSLLQKGFIDEVWLTGSEISPGMQEEQEEAMRLKIKVENKIGLF